MLKDHFARMVTPTEPHHEDIMKSYSLWFCAILVVFAGAAQTVQAQVITNGEIERGLRFRGPAYDGESYTARYSYGLGAAPIYLNGDARQLYYLDYLDRADRAHKFGYRMPIDPYFETPIEEVAGPEVIAVPARGYIGGGFGIFRRR
jgi:hypothetical protein